MARGMQAAWLLLVAGMLLSCISTLSAAPPPANETASDGAAKPTSPQEALQRERDNLSAEVLRLTKAGDMERAIAVGEQRLAVERKLSNLPTAAQAEALSWLGGAELQRDKFDRAVKYFEEAYGIQRSLLGHDHWKVTDARIALDGARRIRQLNPAQRHIYDEAGDANAAMQRLKGEHKLAEAAAESQKCCDAMRQLFGDTHPYYVWCVNDHALLLHQLGKYGEAEKLYRDVLKIRQQALGESHPDYASTLVSLAVLLKDRSDFSHAVPLLEQAIRIERKTEGEATPLYAATVNHLATVYHRSGNYVRAKTLYEQAIELRRKLVGKDHPDYASAVEGLGTLLQAMGQFGEAEKLLHQSLEIAKATSGPGTSDYATTLFNVAELYREMNKLDQAEALFQEVVDTYHKVLGDTHPWYARSLESSAEVAQAKGNFPEAEKLIQEALRIRQKSLGLLHPEYALSLQRLAQLHAVQGKYAQSEPLWQQALAIHKQSLGNTHPWAVACLSGMAHLCDEKGDFARAEELYLQALEITKQSLGDKHPSYAAELNNLAELYKHMDRPQQAEPLYLASLEITRLQYGPTSPNHAKALSNLAQLAAMQGDYTRAEKLQLEAIELLKKTMGEQHADYAAGLDNLASLYSSKGNYARAEQLFRQALEIEKKALGENHPKYAVCLNNLAILYCKMDDYARGEPLYRQAVEAKRRALGDTHPDYARSLGNLATLYVSMSDFARAEPLCKRALEIQKAALGEEHVANASALHNLAHLYQRMGEPLRAEPLYLQELEIQRKRLGNDHPDSATTLNNLGVVYVDIGDWQRAEPLFREALTIREKTLGPNHALCGTTLSSLAEVCKRRHDYVQAEAMLQRSVKILKSTLGETNASYSVALNNFAWLEFIVGRESDAQQHLLEVLRINRRILDQTAAVQSERQQLAMSNGTRAFLDGYLSAALAAKSSPEEMYAEVAACKGSIAAQQQLVRARQRTAIASPDSELARMFADLEQKTRKLAALYSYTPKPDERQAYDSTARELSEAIEDLQQRLSKLDAEFHRLWAERKLSAAEVRQSLPPDTALVDLLAYSNYRPPTKAGEFESWERRYLAFVLRRDLPVACIELGPVAPIDNLIDAWRAGYGELPTCDGKQPGNELRRLVWDPIAVRLGDTRIALISPDSSFARLAWAALPGEKPGEYLIEERAIAILPVPQRLPNLLAAAPATGTDASLLAAGNVDFGAALTARVSEQSRAAVIRGNRVVWPPLIGTKVEIEEVQAIFAREFQRGSAKLLVAGEATEEAFRRDAGKYRFLHVATHGYFAALDGNSTVPPVDATAQAGQPAADTPGRVGINVEMREGRCIVTQVAPGAAAAVDGRIRVGDQLISIANSDGDWFAVSGQAVATVLSKLRGPADTRVQLKVRLHSQPDQDLEIALVRTPMPPNPQGANSLSGLHPGLLSGIVLAGANLPPDPKCDDGILTAFEVSELNLEHVELVTLSACETGLGQSAAGEGLLGLQRSLQMAGVRSTISGLWKVPDHATQMLMVRFYDK